jgi:hypothetical protein
MQRCRFAFAFLIAACNTGLPLENPQGPFVLPPSDVCTASTSGSVVDASAVSGSFEGPELAGTFCAGGTFANLEQTPDSIGAGSNLYLFINTQGTHTCSVQTPSGGYDCDLQILMSVPTPSPGTYQSSSGGPCDQLLFTATAPPTVTSCGGVSSPAQCPPGCSYGAQPNGFPGGGAPCVPSEGPSVQYSAAAGGLCLDTETYAQLGSWTLTLTSVTPEDGGSQLQGTYYIAHGSLTATMISGRDLYTGELNPADGDNTSATLSISF